MRAAEIRRLLPSVFRRSADTGSPLAALLAVMEDIHAPVERAYAALPMALDARTAPDDFVPFLAEWVGARQVIVGAAPSDGSQRAEAGGGIDTVAMRELVRAAADLAKWRGTKRGLMQLLTIATGIAGFEVREGEAADGSPRPFAITVVVPVTATAQLPLINRIVAQEKPAYVTYAVRTAAPTPGPDVLTVPASVHL